MNLHLGCGKSKIKGWLHVDMRAFPHVSVLADASQLPFKRSSFEQLYASHVLEHFGIGETVTVLKEWRRVLKKDGTLYVAVPNWDALIKLYLESGAFDTYILRLLYGDQGEPWQYHKTAFAWPYLRGALQRAGFGDIEGPVEFDIKTNPKDCSLLCAQASAGAAVIPLSLNVIARK